MTFALVGLPACEPAFRPGEVDGHLHEWSASPPMRAMVAAFGGTLQNRRITYAVAGKGTFVHPDAMDLLRGGVLQEPIDDPELRRRVAAYLADQQAITIRYHQARTLDDKNTALQDLLDHADTHSQLIDEVIKYQTDHGNFAKPPAIAAVTTDDEPPAPPAKRRSSRTREPKQ